MLQTPGNDVFNRIEDLVPGSAKRHGCLLPRKPPCPACQEQHVGFGQSAFAVTPGNFFDDHGATAGAVDAPHRVQQENKKSPERNEFKAPLAELIVTGCRLMASRTDRRRAFAWPHRHLDTLFVQTEAGLLIDKSPEAVAAV